MYSLNTKAQIQQKRIVIFIDAANEGGGKNLWGTYTYNYATRYLDEKYSHKSGDRFPPDPVCNDGALVWKDIPYVVATMNGSEDEKEDQDVVCGIVKIINDVLMKNNDLPDEE